MAAPRHFSLLISLWLHEPACQFDQNVTIWLCDAALYVHFLTVFSLSPYHTEKTQPGNSGGRGEQDVTQSLTHTE
jgi:hypothetical protein